MMTALTLALATSASCHARKPAADLADASGSNSTSIYGQWVLAPPIEATGFAGASRVELVLTPGTFTIKAAYPDRAALEMSGRADLTNGGLLTLVPSGGAAERVMGLTAGEPYTRLATASGSTLVLAPPGSRVPVPSSVWYRRDAARTAGLVR